MAPESLRGGRVEGSPAPPSGLNPSVHPRGFRVLPNPIFSGVLVVTWLLLVNSIHPRMILLGVVFAVSVPWLSQLFLPRAPRIHSWRAGFRFVPVFLWDVVVANVVVSIIILRVGFKPRSSWLVVPLDVRDPFAAATLANVISLTPGTVSSRFSADRTELLVHALDVTDPAAAVVRMKERYEKPLMEVFEG